MSENIRDFGIMDKNLIDISTMLSENETICKLLVNSGRDALSKPSVEDGLDLINKNIRIVPSLPADEFNQSYIVIVFDEFIPAYETNEFLNYKIKCDVVCPISDWVIDEGLRPFKIMGEVKKMIAGKVLNGLGKVRFEGADILYINGKEVGYSLIFSNYDLS